MWTHICASIDMIEKKAIKGDRMGTKALGIGKNENNLGREEGKKDEEYGLNDLEGRILENKYVFRRDDRLRVIQGTC